MNILPVDIIMTSYWHAKEIRGGGEVVSQARPFPFYSTNHFQYQHASLGVLWNGKGLACKTKGWGEGVYMLA